MTSALAALYTPRFIRDDGSRRYSWGEWSPKWGAPRLDITNLGNDDGCLTLVVGLIFCSFYIRLHVNHSWEMWEEGLGFYFSDDALVLEWPWAGRNGKKLFLRYPWGLDFHKRWERVENDGWPRDEAFWIEIPRRMSYGTLGTKHVYDFSYTLKSGEVQKCKATVYVDRMEWRRRCLRWTPLFNLVRDSISVTFDGEVGEQAGSWKGGVTGCGYEMKRDETPEQCLNRMALERMFT